MSWSYNFIDHTADIAMEIRADSLSGLFTAAAYGWKETVTDSPVENKLEINLKLSDNSIELLLVKFLDELNYFLAAKKFLLSGVKELVIEENDEIILSTVLFGEIPDENRHLIKEEIKAVTFHQMEIRKTENELSTMVVFDI